VYTVGMTEEALRAYHREYMRVWRLRHHDRLKAAARAKHAADPIRRRNAHREYLLNRTPEQRERDRLDQRRRTHLMKYGLTEQQFSDMLLTQNGRCDICGQPFHWRLGEPFKSRTAPVVDHDHVTKKVRALVHQRCNVALGFIESSGLLSQCLAYLAKHKGGV
jgi:alpha-D-ribose 1-methylphosphonate 5-triphosphate diphosphatase PhnM